MKKLSNYYPQYTNLGKKKTNHLINCPNVDSAFNKVVANGIKELEMNEVELYHFLSIHYRNIPIDVDVASGQFTFWGVQIFINYDKNKN